MLFYKRQQPFCEMLALLVNSFKILLPCIAMYQSPRAPRPRRFQSLPLSTLSVLVPGHSVCVNAPRTDGKWIPVFRQE